MATINGGLLVVVFDVDGQRDQKQFFTPAEGTLAERFRANRRGRLLSYGPGGATDLTPKGPSPKINFVTSIEPPPALTLVALTVTPGYTGSNWPAPEPVSEADNYKGLQAEAKRAGLRATGSAKAISERLEAWKAAGRPTQDKPARSRRKAVAKAVAA